MAARSPAGCRKQFYADIVEAQVAVFGAPAVDGLGNAGGFKLMVEDLGDVPLDVLQGQSENLADKGSKLPGIAGLFSSFRANAPQLYIDIDRTKCKTMNVSLNDVFNTLQVYLGGYYVNDFNQFGRTWQVNLQADAPFRLKAEDVRQLKTRNAAGEMLPLGTVATIEDIGGPTMITRYNMHTAAALNGAALPGVSTGTVISQSRGPGEAGIAQEHDVRMDRADVLAASGGERGLLCVCRRRGAGVSGAGGPVRELHAAAGDHPRRADVPARLAGGRGD